MPSATASVPPISPARYPSRASACFHSFGALAGLAGVLLAGYSTKAYQAMGDPYLLPAIAAVVLGGTNILGGRGTYLGTIAGRHTYYPAAVDPFSDADRGIRTSDHLWRRHRRDAADLWPGTRPVAVMADAAGQAPRMTRMKKFLQNIKAGGDPAISRPTSGTICKTYLPSVTLSRTFFNVLSFPAQVRAPSPRLATQAIESQRWATRRCSIPSMP